MPMRLAFVTEPYFKCSCKYIISYFSCLLFFIGLVILVIVTVPDYMLNATVIRFAFICSSFFLSILFSRIMCICLLKEEEEEEEVLNVNQETGQIIWYN
jgi:hypothetical protein